MDGGGDRARSSAEYQGVCLFDDEALRKFCLSLSRSKTVNRLSYFIKIVPTYRPHTHTHTHL